MQKPILMIADQTEDTRCFEQEFHALGWTGSDTDGVSRVENRIVSDRLNRLEHCLQRGQVRVRISYDGDPQDGEP